MECDIASYHVESFNYLADIGVNLAALDVPHEKFRLPSGEAVEFCYTGAVLGKPSYGAGVSPSCRLSLSLVNRIRIAMDCHCIQRNAANEASLIEEILQLVSM